jgi:hypothetical protein
MWKLISLFSIYFSLLGEPQIIVIDDCQNWKKLTEGFKYKGNFILYRDQPRDQSISLGYAWLDSGNMPKNSKISFAEINDKNARFSSELSFEDWRSFFVGKKIFILLPEDFCSSKRLEFGHQITLYEVSVRLSVVE